MKYSTWKHLNNLREEEGNEVGKLVQKFLALALLEIGASKLTERAIEGVDIDFELDGCEWAMEVKIVIKDEGNSVTLGKKDFKGLDGRIERDRRAMFAFLGHQLTDDWLFIPHPGSGLQPNDKTSMVLLRALQDTNWAGKINEPFEKMVEQHILVARDEGQKGLNKVLNSHPDYLLA